MDRLSLTGALLVATPLLEDPNFYRSVVFVIDDTPDEGTLGVILNRPSELGVGEVLAEWGEHVSQPAVMFAGGPVGQDAGLALAVPDDGQRPLGWKSLDAMDAKTWPNGLGTVDLDTPPQLSSSLTRCARCGFSPDTRGGAPVSSEPRLTREPGMFSQRPLMTCSAPIPGDCGRGCCGARAGSSLSWPPSPTTRH